MSKMIEFKDKAQECLLKGVVTLAKAVKVTMGPRGRNVCIKNYSNTESTKDGVSVAKKITLKDPRENMGVKLVTEAALKTSDLSGDGTTTSIVLAEAMIEEGARFVRSGANPMLLKQGMDKAVSIITKSLSSMAKQIVTKEEIEQIATISSNNDSNLGKIVFNAIDLVGKEGLVTLGQSATPETELELLEGMNFDKGYISPYFVTNAEKMTVEFEQFHLLLINDKISSVQEIVPFLEKFAESKMGPLLIIAKDISDEALSLLVLNKIKVGHALCAVKAPGLGEEAKTYLEDIAILTGATVVSKQLDQSLETVDLTVLGKAKKGIISKEKTTIIDGFGSKDKILAKKHEIKTQMEVSPSQSLEKRLANLSGKICQIKIGASTEIEFKEKKTRIEDALSATKAAIAEGVIPGGGVALLRAMDSLVLDLTGDEALGVLIIKKACRAPAKTIADNCGKEGNLIVEKILEKEGDFGYNGLTNSFSNLLEEGVIDPVLVTKGALRHAASISSMLLTCSVMITSKS